MILHTTHQVENKKIVTRETLKLYKYHNGKYYRKTNHNLIMKSTSIYAIVLYLSYMGATAQTITITFPYFAGKTYEFKIVQGKKHIVLQKDTIAEGGNVQLQIPRKYKGYKGMAMWYITNSATGGGLEMVINNEDFSVSCFAAIPTSKNIIYTNSPENLFMHSNNQEQQALFAKHDAMLSATKAYTDKNNGLHRVFSKEYIRILQEYRRYVKRLKKTKLYAARFSEITNLTRGIGTIITQDENLKAKNINTIIVNQLDYEVLFTSNHWGGIINTWVQLQVNVLKNDAQFINDASTIFKRISSDLIRTQFMIGLKKALKKVGKKETILVGLSKKMKGN